MTHLTHSSLNAKKEEGADKPPLGLSDPRPLIQLCQLFQVDINKDFDQSFSPPEVKRAAVLWKINLKLKFLVQLSLDL